MKVLDAVATVLEKSGTPLHCQQITKQIVDGGYWMPKTKTPNATVASRLAVDLKKGKKSRFQRTDKGVYGLRVWGNPEFKPSPPAKKKPKKEITETKKLSFTDATERILNESGSKQPMHYREIAKRILTLGLVQTSGKTPHATLYAQVLTETKRRSKRGEQPRFVMHGRGHVGLAKWMAKGIAFQIEQHNAQVRKKLKAQISKMPPVDFEALTGTLLIALGFDDVEVTNLHGDQGIDVRGTMVTAGVVRTQMAVQVKRWKHNVQAPAVQQLRGSLGSREQGLIITTSDFSTGARTESQRPNATPVALMNGEELVKLLIENDIGVHRTAHDMIELGELPGTE